MPRFSLVVPLYNGEKHITDCLTSICTQDYTDIEVIVVDDASTDDSLQLVSALAEQDPRVCLLKHSQNTGTLQARKDGVLAAKGDYLLLVDQDDALAPGALMSLACTLDSCDADIIHFGCVVVAHNSEAQKARDGMSQFVNPLARSLEGEVILDKQFAENEGFDWQVHHKAIKMSLAKKAWSALQDVRLTLSDDLYASFALCTYAQSYVAIPDAKWYVYNLGLGETFGSAFSRDDLMSILERDLTAYKLVCSFTEQTGILREDFKARTSDALAKLVAHTLNEMWDKLPEEQWKDTLEDVISIWPPEASPFIAENLMRFARDLAWAAWRQCLPFDGKASYCNLYRRAQKIIKNSAFPATERFYIYTDFARRHIGDLEGYTHPQKVPAAEVSPFRQPEWEASDIRIFVSTHKNVKLFNSTLLQPVQVGGLSSGERLRFCWALQDDAGDNIAWKNNSYCELSTQWWAWKNTQAPMVGFCHYRRYFDFSGEEHAKNDFGEIMASFIDGDTQKTYGLFDEQISRALKEVDIAVSTRSDVRQFPGGPQSPREQYAAPTVPGEESFLNVRDFDRVMAICRELYPEYSFDVDSYVRGSCSSFCNMFVMKREIFDRYCSWLFDILTQFEDGWDTSHASHQYLRTPGHLAERLLNVFILHEKRIYPARRIKEFDCVHFEHPERPVLPMRLVPQNASDKTVIPVVLAADDGYSRQLATTIYSLLSNASRDFSYDLIVLHTDITEAHQEELIRFTSPFFFARLRFVDVSAWTEPRTLSTNNDFISKETYFRFLIQEICSCYDKVLYLDADVAVLGDISRLFSVDLGDCCLAAVRDIDFCANLNLSDGLRKNYAREVLSLEDPYGYFQAGVLVLNIRELEKLHPVYVWLDMADNPVYIYNDQDILNKECQGRVVYLDPRWNVMHNNDHRVERLFSHAPAPLFDAYMESRKNPLVVHYAGWEKPWKLPDCDMARIYLGYMEKTPLLAVPEVLPERVIAEDSKLRNVLDPLMPFGSRRRELAKRIGAALKNRDKNQS